MSLLLDWTEHEENTDLLDHATYMERLTISLSRSKTVPAKSPPKHLTLFPIPLSPTCSKWPPVLAEDSYTRGLSNSGKERCNSGQYHPLVLHGVEQLHSQEDYLSGRVRLGTGVISLNLLFQLSKFIPLPRITQSHSKSVLVNGICRSFRANTKIWTAQVFWIIWTTKER